LEGYGLLARQPIVEDGQQKDYLGPRPELLQKIEDQKKQQLNDKLNKSRADVSKLSEEEKMRRLAEMEQDASVNESYRSNRLVVKQEKDESGQGTGKFLQEMRTEVYKQAADSDLKDRLDQNRYYRQGSSDLEGSSNFLKR
jgi:hypothetical protein